MDRVAAEIPKEISVLFEDQHIDPGPGQQETDHKPGRTAPSHATACHNWTHHRPPSSRIGLWAPNLHGSRQPPPALPASSVRATILRTPPYLCRVLRGKWRVRAHLAGAAVLHPIGLA